MTSSPYVDLDEMGVHTIIFYVQCRADNDSIYEGSLGAWFGDTMLEQGTLFILNHAYGRLGTMLAKTLPDSEVCRGYGSFVVQLQRNQDATLLCCRGQERLVNCSSL